MDSHLPTKWKLKALIQEADTRLQEISCCSFSKKAKAVLRRKISSYIIDLITNSAQAAKRQNLEGISAIHVEEASNNLTNKPNARFLKHIGTIGGIFLGASISALIGIIAEECYSAANILLAVSFGIIGVFMVAYYIAKE